MATINFVFGFEKTYYPENMIVYKQASNDAITIYFENQKFFNIKYIDGGECHLEANQTQINKYIEREINKKLENLDLSRHDKKIKCNFIITAHGGENISDLSNESPFNDLNKFVNVRELTLTIKYIINHIKDNCGNRSPVFEIKSLSCDAINGNTNPNHEDFFMNNHHKNHLNILLQDLDKEGINFKEFSKISGASNNNHIEAKKDFIGTFYRPNQELVKINISSCNFIDKQTIRVKNPEDKFVCFPQDLKENKPVKGLKRIPFESIDL